MAQNDNMRNKECYKKIYNLESWQGIHVRQLSYLRNLIIILATASLGFSLNLFFDNVFKGCGQIIAIKTACVLLLASITFGLLIAILESENYRLKYRIGRMIENHTEDFIGLPADINKIHNNCSAIESINRIFIYGQLIMFVISVIILLITFIL